jgi:hypothetical protein
MPIPISILLQAPWSVSGVSAFVSKCACPRR